MRKSRFLIGTFIFVICLYLVVFLPLGTAQPVTNLTVLTGARLIDGTGQPPMENVDILVQADQIRTVLKSGTQPYPKGARIIDFAVRQLYLH